MSAALGFVPPLPRLSGIAAIGAAIHAEADYRMTLADEGPGWTRERHITWLRVAWASLNESTEGDTSCRP